jgi:hypothetical protein
MCVYVCYLSCIHACSAGGGKGERAVRAPPGLYAASVTGQTPQHEQLLQKPSCHMLVTAVNEQHSPSFISTFSDGLLLLLLLLRLLLLLQVRGTTRLSRGWSMRLKTWQPVQRYLQNAAPGSVPLIRAKSPSAQLGRGTTPQLDTRLAFVF